MTTLKKYLLLLILVFFALMLASCSGTQKPALPPLAGETGDLSDEFMAKLVAEDFEGATEFFDAKMQKVFPAKKLKKAWLDLLARLGTFIEITDKKEAVIQGYKTVNNLTAFEGGDINIRVVFSDDNRVSGLWFLDTEN